MFIIYSVRFSIPYKNFNTRNIFNCSNNILLVCSLIEFKNNYLREYNSQLSRFVVYVNHHIAASLSESWFKRDVKPPKRIRGTEDAKYSRLDLCCRVTFQVSHSPSNKTRSSLFTKTLTILQRRLNFKYRTKPRE